MLTPFVPSGPGAAYGLALPSGPALVGLDLHTTAALFTSPPANPFGALTANGLHGRLGTL